MLATRVGIGKLNPSKISKFHKITPIDLLPPCPCSVSFGDYCFIGGPLTGRAFGTRHPTHQAISVQRTPREAQTNASIPGPTCLKPSSASTCRTGSRVTDLSL